MKILRSRYLQLQEEISADVPDKFGITTPYKKIQRNYSSKFIQKEEKEPTNKSPELTKDNSTTAVRRLLGRSNDYNDSTAPTTTTSPTTTTPTPTTTTPTTTTDTSSSSITSYKSNRKNKICKIRSTNLSSNTFASYSQTSQQQSEHDRTGNSETTCNSEFDSIKITLRDIPEHASVKVYIHPVDMDRFWLSKMYRKYENDLWNKSLRDPTIYSKKWCYHCLLCQQSLMKFETLKYHLNRHLKLCPYVCKFCGRPFSNRQTAVQHLQRSHGIQMKYTFFLGN